jgi:UDP:flavonoid glycosyltransferase YjiC (YdhE family)
MVMPSLRNQTNLLEQGWFTNRTTLLPTKNKENRRVLITGGGTKLINKQLLALTLVVISRLPNIEFFLDSKLFKMAEKIETKLTKFSFSEADFASLDYIICRPGVGILTDCVRFSVPPLVINDGFNREINHNTEKVNELVIGMGVDINENNLNEVADKLCKVIENDQLKLEYVKALNNRIVNGAYSASREIINFLNNG